MRRPLVVVLFGLAAGLAAAPLSEGQEPTVQLAVESLSVDNVPAWFGDVPNGTTVHVVVRNQGAAAFPSYVLQYRWKPDGGEPVWLNENEVASQDADTGGALPAGATRTHEATWRLQPGQEGAGTLLLTVQWGAANRTAMLPLLVPTHRLTVNLESTNLTLVPEETGFIRIALRNEGNVAQAVSLGVPDSAVGNQSRLIFDLVPPELSVPAASTRQATLFVTYPFRGDLSPFSANATVRASWVGGLLDLSTPTLFGEDCCGQTGYSWNLTALQPNGTGVLPGQTGAMSFIVSNNALSPSLEDSYRPVATPPPGWTALVTPSRFALRPGETTRFDVLLQAPMETPGPAGDLQVSVASDHVPAASRNTSLPLRISGPAPIISLLEPTPQPAYIGDGLQARLRVANRGDQDSSPLAIRITAHLPDGWFQQDLQTGALPLEQESEFLVSFPRGATIPGAARLEAGWGAAGSAANQGLVVTHFAVRRPSVQVTAPAAQTGGPGEAVNYQGPAACLLVRNLGSFDETLEVAVVAANGSAVLFQPVFDLPAGQERCAPMLHSLPRPAGNRTTDVLAVRVAVRARPDFNWSATIATSIVDLEPPVLFAAALPSPWALQAPLTLRVEAHDDGRVDAVEAYVEAAFGAGKTIALSAQGSNWTELWTPTMSGNYSVTYRARDAAGHNASTSPISVQVLAVPPPVLRIRAPEGPVSTDGALTFTVEDSRAIVLLQAWRTDDPGNATEALFRDGRGLVPLGPLHLPSGPATITVRAVNDAGATATSTATIEVLALATQDRLANDEASGESARQSAGFLLPALVAALGAAALRQRAKAR